MDYLHAVFGRVHAEGSNMKVLLKLINVSEFYSCVKGFWVVISATTWALEGGLPWKHFYSFPS